MKTSTFTVGEGGLYWEWRLDKSHPAENRKSLGLYWSKVAVPVGTSSTRRLGKYLAVRQ